jgi:hypothetical protein
MSEPCVRFFDAIGVDPTSPDDRRRVREALRWAAEEQSEKSRLAAEAVVDRRDRRMRRFALLYSIAATLVGGLTTWLVTHLMAHLP